MHCFMLVQSEEAFKMSAEAAEACDIQKLMFYHREATLEPRPYNIKHLRVREQT